MIINKGKDVTSYIKKLINMYEQNLNVTEVINAYLQDFSQYNKNKDVYSNILDSLNIDKNDDYLKRLENDNKINDIIKLDINKYKNNPYFKNINFDHFTSNKWTLEHNEYNPYEAFLYQDITIDENNYYAEINALGYFDEVYKYPSIIQNDTIWMLISPHEINTMQKAIDEVKGKVLVYGLGLGYFPYMISLKEDVDKIIIIEKDQSAIELFNKYIFNQFENKNKIKIIKDDAFEFTKNNLKTLDFDYAFFDIYHNVDDALPLYLKMLSLEKLNKHTKFIYWIEKSLINAIRRALIVLLEEELISSSDDRFKINKTDFDRLINKLHFKLKNHKINTLEDIKKLLDDNNIKNLFR